MKYRTEYNSKSLGLYGKVANLKLKVLLVRKDVPNGEVVESYDPSIPNYVLDKKTPEYLHIFVPGDIFEEGGILPPAEIKLNLLEMREMYEFLHQVFKPEIDEDVF